RRRRSAAMIQRSLMLAATVAMFVTQAPTVAVAGGVIIHGRELAEKTYTMPNRLDEECDERCRDYMMVLEHIFESDDARISRAVDARGEALSFEMLDDPEAFGLDPNMGSEGGCAASGGSLFAAFGALALLRRRRRRSA
ncbi:MAG: MYXO-CTERM sorting domain-containing protein, partial [Myxococcota bacterium]